MAPCSHQVVNLHTSPVSTIFIIIVTVATGGAQRTPDTGLGLLETLLGRILTALLTLSIYILQMKTLRLRNGDRGRKPSLFHAELQDHQPELAHRGVWEKCRFSGSNRPRIRICLLTGSLGDLQSQSSLQNNILGHTTSQESTCVKGMPQIWLSFCIVGLLLI